jgi:hypothetical protein
MERERVLPLVIGTLAVAAGVAFLLLIGALPGMGSRNIASYLLGLLLGWIFHRLANVRHATELLFALACIMLVATLMFGIELDGVTRWLAVGPINLQPALILAPLLLCLAASKEARHWRAVMLVPVGLIALQPDAATSFGLALGVAAMMEGAASRAVKGWSARRMATAGGALALAVVALVFAGIQTPPPVAFVEGTVDIASISGPSAIGLHFLAVALMVAALIVANSVTGWALAAYFLVSVLAAVFWAFPMPVVGAGPSHMIGFGLAIGWLASGRQRAVAHRFSD